MKGISIKRVHYSEIKPLVPLAEKERTTMANPHGAHWFGAFNGDEVVGCCCAVMGKGITARLKSDFVKEEYRGKGIYRRLFAARYNHAMCKGYMKFTAFCTPLSIGIYIEYGFKASERSRKGSDIVFVHRDIRRQYR